MKMPKQGLEVIRDFEKAGLEIEVVAGTKHYLVYHAGELVYKFGQGSTQPAFAQRTRAALIRKLQKARAESQP